MIRAVGEKAFEALLLSLLSRWVGPEIDRRLASEDLPADFSLSAAQVVFPSDEAPVVLLNGEIQGQFRARAAKPQEELTPGTLVNLGEAFEEITGFSMDVPNPQTGFVTILNHRDKWLVFANVAHNLDFIGENLDAAMQFIQAAELAIQNELLRPAIDNLFSATELLNRALLLELPREYRPHFSHDHVWSEFHRWKEIHGSDPEYVAAVKTLSSQRNPARYLSKPTSLTLDEAKGISKIARRMHTELVDRRTELAELQNPVV